MIHSILANKRILVGITGSISAYKITELVRMFIKAGAEVRVVMTKSATKFITPLTFETLTTNKVLLDDNEDWTNSYNHIKIGKWADIFVIAPASANTINKLNNGIADNMLTQIALAFERVKIIAPAANTNMLNNPITQSSFKMLKLCNYKFIETIKKELACGDIGDGALADIKDIFYFTARELLRSSYWEHRKVVVSSGGTIERLDDIRYISNFSSGKMGANLALALYLRGADVCLVSTRGHQDLPKGIHIIEVESSSEMFEYLSDCLRVARKGVVVKPDLINDEKDIKVVQKKPFLFMVAAVSDFVPRYKQDGKIKKESLDNYFAIEFKKNIDILSTIKKGGIYSIGFKAEMDERFARKDAFDMITKKNIDGVCLNILKSDSFGSDTNKIEFITSKVDKPTYNLSGTKLSISLRLTKILEEEFSE